MKNQRKLTADWKHDGQSWRNMSTDGSLNSCCWKGLFNGAMITHSFCPMQLVYIFFLFTMYFLTDATNTLVRLIYIFFLFITYFLTDATNNPVWLIDQKIQSFLLIVVDLMFLSTFLTQLWIPVLVIMVWLLLHCVRIIWIFYWKSSFSETRADWMFLTLLCLCHCFADNI